MRINIFHFFILLLVAFFPGVATAGLTILDGEHTVIYDIVNPRGVAFIPDYSNESFSQKVISRDEFSKRVQVTSRMHAMKTRVPYPVAVQSLSADAARFLMPEKDRQSGDPSLRRLVREITRESRFAHEAANAILSWIADQLQFDATITVPSDALSALRLRKAYCVGYSNLAVAMLRAAGIPARVAHGYLPPGYEWGFSTEYWGVKVKDGGYHAYIEIFYPDSGWVFSDAEHSHNFVDPFHIVLRIDGIEMPGASKGGFLDVDKATFYTVYQEADNAVKVDELQTPKERRLGRRMDDRQYAPVVTGSVQDSKGNPVSNGTVVVWKDGRGASTSFAGGRYSAVLSRPGKYRIELRGAGFAKTSRDVQAASGQVQRLNVTLSPGGVIKGRVTDSSGKPLSDGDVFYREGNTSFGVPVDVQGMYRIEGLAPGAYAVSAVSGEKNSTRRVIVESGKEAVQDFLIR